MVAGKIVVVFSCNAMHRRQSGEGCVLVLAGMTARSGPVFIDANRTGKHGITGIFLAFAGNVGTLVASA